MNKTILSACILSVASGLMAQTGPNGQSNWNMNGEVEALKYINPANTYVDLDTYKDYVAWGAVNEACVDPINGNQTLHAANYATSKISTKIGKMSIQHCHGRIFGVDPGILPVGSTSFKWGNGQLHPLKHSKSKFGFWTDHYLRHYVPVVNGQKVSVKLWVATGAPTNATNAQTAIRVDFFPGWNGVLPEPNNSSKTNNYYFTWENKTSVVDHAYTLNFTPTFTGCIAIDVGNDLVEDPSNTFGVVWFKALTLQDGRSDGVVTAGSYAPNKFSQQYYIRFKNSGKVMEPDYGTGYAEGSPDLLPGETVKLRTRDDNDKNQWWTIRPSNLSGYSNIWTKGGALTSRQYWWVARSLTKPDLGDAWQQVQFVDGGNGYKKIKFAAKGPAGEDLFLTSYDNTEGGDIAVYFGGIDGQLVALDPAKHPMVGATYQVQNVNSGKCLTVAGASTASGANIEQRTCNALNNQKITLTFPATDYYGLRFQHSSQVMNIEGTGNGAWAAQRPYNSGSNSQMFALLDHNDGTFSFQFRHSGQCGDIDVGSTADGARAKQNPCTYANRQKFRFLKVP
ncbi:MAG TPA: RICIN domain-containing protein [Fibrobacteria bacterium]|nr:RICIN domain-containing protein [Fibrobacteria bacterium]